MTERYRERYHIIDLFKSTSAQEIFIGTSKSPEAMPVIINMIKDPYYFPLLEEEVLSTTLSNLLHYEKLEDTLVLVTRVLESQPLLVYMEENYVPMKSRMDYAFQYLKTITKYQRLPEEIQQILLDGAQLVLDGERLEVDELLIIGDGLNSRELPQVNAQVAAVLSRIIFFDYSALQQEELMLAEVQEFLSSLEQHQGPLDLQRIYQTFRKLYIYHYCMEGIEDPSQPKPQLVPVPKPKPKPKPVKEESKAEEAQEQEEARKKNIEASALAAANRSIDVRKWALVAALIFLLGGGVYALTRYWPFGPGEVTGPPSVPGQEEVLLKAAFRMNEKDGNWEFFNESTGPENNPIEAYLWEIIYGGQVIQSVETKDLVLAFKRDGEYQVSLKVKGADGTWSEAYVQSLIIEASEEGDIVEQFRHFTLSTVGQNNILKDTSTRYSSEYAFKLVNDENLPPTFTLSELQNDSYASLSLVAKTVQPEQLTMKLAAYGQDKLLYREEAKYEVKPEDGWKLLHINLPAQSVEEVKLEITGFDDTVWIDAIGLDVNK